jgi:hypothetical protein
MLAIRTVFRVSLLSSGAAAAREEVTSQPEPGGLLGLPAPLLLSLQLPARAVFAGE